jgi:phage-related protein|nr:MAG TPA: tail tape measure protein [Caudoviricetes sp.]
MNLFELFVKIGADTTEANKGIDEVGQKTSGIGEKLKSGLATAGKVAVAGVAAGATAIGALGTKAVEAYADYEQFVGGVETLFKDSQDQVMDYANNAYKTAGLSANEYMETVTSFSASLLQSLDGDTSAAADKANLAITDMSDNANKMGTDMTSIQNAYQGFAKANYTMLDNLKLGYGGTQAEMERLLADAEKISGIKYDISSYADIVDAIHVVQTEMGITGTTAEEAASTIQGSFGMMKSAWQNLVTGMADPSQDLGVLVGNFTESVVTFGNNVIPRIQELLPRIVEATTSLIGTVSEQLPAILGTVLPSLVEGATNLVTGLMAALPSVLSVLADVAPTVINTLVPALIELLPQITQTGIDVIVSLAQGIADALPQLIPAATDAIIKIVEVLTSPDNLGNLIDAALAIILALVDGLVDATPKLIAAVPDVITNLVTAIIANMPKILEAGVEITMAIADGLIKAIPELVAAIPNLILGIVQGIIDNLPEIIMAGPKIIAALATGLIEAIPDIVMVIPQLIRSIVDTFLSFDWGSIGKNIVEGIKNGFVNMWNSFKQTVENVFTGLVDGVKSFLGIASPSKVFAGIGGYMAEGLGQGFDKEFSSVKRGIQSQLDFGTMTFGMSSFGRLPALAGAGTTNNYYSINADRVKQFNDIIRITENERLTSRMGVSA